MSSSVAEAIRTTFDKRAIVASVNEAMIALKIGRAKIYELINSGELESYGRSNAAPIRVHLDDDYFAVLGEGR